MEPVDPLTIEDIGFGTSRGMLGLAGIDQVDSKPRARSNSKVVSSRRRWTPWRRS